MAYKVTSLTSEVWVFTVDRLEDGPIRRLGLPSIFIAPGNLAKLRERKPKYNATHLRINATTKRVWDSN